MESLSLLRLLVGVGFMGYASYTDVKTRKVSNKVWMVMGLVGFVILALDLTSRSETTWAHYLIFLPAGVMYYDVYLDREPIWDEEGLHFQPLAFSLIAAVIIILSIQVSLLYNSPEQWNLFLQLATIPGMILLAHLFFELGLLRGGADAKALMALAVLLPFYPEFWGFPLVQTNSVIIEVLFPFSLVVLMNSAILVIFLPLAYLAINAARGDLKIPECLLGYKADLSSISKHVWLMEKVEGQEIRTFLFPRRSSNLEEDIAALKKAGRTRAWVTPQLPFMLPLAIGLIASFFIGNFILALFLVIP